MTHRVLSLPIAEAGSTSLFLKARTISHDLRSPCDGSTAAQDKSGNIEANCYEVMMKEDG